MALYRLPRAAALAWIAFAAFMAPALWFGGSPTPAGTVAAALAIGIAGAHAVLALGWREAGAFLAICLAVTFAAENLGVLTGVPFGRYHFTVGAGLPHVGAVPLIVGFLYFGMGYPSWVVAGVLLDEAGTRPDTPFKRAALPLVATFVMVQWDVVMDLASSTLGGAWVWHDGGGYFGVPLSNYAGWYLTVWAFFQGFAIVSGRHGAPPPAPRRPAFWLVPLLLYLGAGLCQVPPLLTTGNATVVDAAGHAWQARDLRETTVIVMAATMLATSVLALLRWSRSLGR